MNHLTRNQYLFIPSVPTPNGPLHLGHIGGPYLSADVCARALRMQGHDAVIICGSDSYESYVMRAADRQVCTAQAIANHYHQQIAADLKAMNISVYDFINPLDETWQVGYQNWHEKILSELQDKHALLEVTEKIAWDDVRQRYLTGADLEGYCPCCQQPVTSYFCEQCGAHFKPENVTQQSSEHLLHQVNNLFLRLPIDDLNLNNGINDNIRKTYATFLNQQQQLFRMTTHHEWGLAYGHQQTLFSYGFLYAYFLFLSEIAQTALKSYQHPFSINSTVTTISCFGIDNAVPFLASTHGISSYCNQFKPFDYYLINYFYYLDGSKFSTSRRHAIWVNDLIYQQQRNSDIVRLFLASINVRDGIGNFCQTAFEQYYQAKIQQIAGIIATPIAATPFDMANQQLQADCRNRLQRQEKYLSLSNYAPNHAVVDIEQWLTLSANYQDNCHDYYWWLKTLCVLSYPFMPIQAKQWWLQLGNTGEPSLLNFFHHDRLEEGYHVA